MATTKRLLVNGLADGDDLPAEDVNLISNTLEVAYTDQGRYASGHVRMAANANDADTVTVTVAGVGKVYEFDNNASVSGTNISVTIGGTAALSATALRAAISTNQGTLLASAVHGTDTTVVDLRVLTAGSTLALAESTSGARVVVQDNAEELAPAAGFLFFRTLTVTAEDVARGRVRVASGLTSIDDYFYQVGGGPYNGTITVSGGVIEFANDGTNDLAAGYTLAIIAFGR